METKTFDRHGTIHEAGVAGEMARKSQRVRARFRVSHVTLHEDSGQVHMDAAHGPGNEDWSKYTPSGTVDMVITNVDALACFVPGQEYFLDFTPA
jgi:hypothetical protein